MGAISYSGETKLSTKMQKENWLNNELITKWAKFLAYLSTLLRHLQKIF